MKQSNTDSAAQKKRKQDAITSAIVSTAWMFLSGLGILLLCRFYRPVGFGGAVLRILAILDLTAIIPVWILLKTRLKEIEGGEEDAAAQY